MPHRQKSDDVMVNYRWVGIRTSFALAAVFTGLSSLTVWGYKERAAVLARQDTAESKIANIENRIESIREEQKYARQDIRELMWGVNVRPTTPPPPPPSPASRGTP